jgi:hypothetical protein
MSFLPRRGSANVGLQHFFFSNLPWNRAPVTIEAIHKFETLLNKQDTLKYSDNGQYHYLTMPKNDGMGGLQQALLHVQYFYTNTRGRNFSTPEAERQFVATTLVGSASSKWYEVCNSLPTANNDLRATLKAFINKYVNDDTTARREQKSYTQYGAKKDDYPHLHIPTRMQ